MFAAVAAAALLLADTGADLNAKGEALLRSGRSAEALQSFRAAAEASPRLAVAFYNVALALADLRHKPNIRVRPTKKDVLDAVEVAAQLDPKLRERAQADFPSVRSTFRGQRLLGRTVEHDSAAILQGIAWRSRADERLDFLSDGTVRYWSHPEFAGVPRPTGRWSVVRGHVTVVFGAKTFEGQLEDDGVLGLAGWGRFFDW